MENLRPVRLEDTQYRSFEELYFSWYLDELIDLGVVKSYDYENICFELDAKGLQRPVFKYRTVRRKDGKQIKVLDDSQVLLRSDKSYTPDFTISYNEDHEYFDFFFSVGNSNALHKDVPFHVINDDVYVEIKPHFDQNNMTREFVIIQKWLYTKGIFVQLIKPHKSTKSLFSSTFTPHRYLYTDVSLIKRTIRNTVQTLEQYIDKCDGFKKLLEERLA